MGLLELQMKKILSACAVALLATNASADTMQTVADLSWIAGAWISKEGDTVEELWLAPDHGVMSGTARTVTAEGKVTVEFMKITTEPAGVTFTAIVGNQPPTPFILLPGEPGVAVFENKAHDFPQRVTYRRCEEDLCARIEGDINGKLEFEEWRYRRANQ